MAPPFQATRSTTLSPPAPEKRPLVSAQTSSSPTHSPRFSSQLEFSFKSRGGEELSGLKTSSLPLGDPPSYQREFNDGQDSSERYQLVGRRVNTSQHDMDLEGQKMREKDVKLKKNIRRFRFVVRSAHLACRFAPQLR